MFCFSFLLFFSMNLSQNTLILLRPGFLHPFLDHSLYEKIWYSGPLPIRDMGAGHLPVPRKSPLTEGQLVQTERRVAYTGPCQLCQKEPLPTLGFSLSSHLLHFLSRCPISFAHLLSCDLSSASLLDPVYDKTSPFTLTKHSSWTVNWGMKKVDLHCLLLPRVHFIT